MRRLTKAVIFALVAGIVCMFALYMGNNAAHPLKNMKAVDPFGEGSGPKIDFSEIHDQRTLKVAEGGKTVEMGLEEYILGVLAAEMPASFEPEALKAQAVAARTFTVYRVMHGGCAKNPGADICGDSGHCQAYCSMDGMKNKWKTNFDKYYNKLKTAVTETAGKIVTYKNQPILVLYHASSANRTENVENVYSQTLPYLRGVPTKDNEVTELEATKDMDRAAFCTAVNSAFPSAKLKASTLEKQISVVSRFASGRVNLIKLGGATAEGTDVRGLADLRSANFTVSFNEDSVVFTTEGNGHGVGMSQYGAQQMAKEGKGYAEILKYYYTGVEVTDIK